MTTTSRTLLSGVKLGMRRRRRWWWRFGGFDRHAMAMPALWDAGRCVALVGQLEAPGAVDEHRCDRQPALDASGLQVLNQRHAVDDERAWQADRVDAAALAGAVDA